MRFKLLLKTTVLTAMLLIGAKVGWGQKTYNLITSNSDLVVGAKYLVVGYNTTNPFAMGLQNANNRSAVSITVSSNSTTVDPATITTETKPFEVTLGGVTGAWTLNDAVNNTFLKPRTGANNGLQGQATTDLAKWAINIAGTGIATMTCETTTEYPRNILKYNATSALFACYASGQNDVYLFKLVEGNTPPQATFTPSNGATKVLVGSNIMIKFNEKIYKSGGITEIANADLPALITIKDGGSAGTEMADGDFTMTYDNTTFTITIDPTTDFALNKDYYVAFGSVFDNLNLENTGGNATFHTELGYIPITNAYALSNDAIDVVYESIMTSVVAGDYNLSGTAAITFTTATIDGTDAKIVHLSGASLPIIGDATLDYIADAHSNYNLYAGILPFSYTNAANPGGTIQKAINATFHGIVSANDANNGVWVADAAGAYNGAYIYNSSFDASVAVGDEIIFRGVLDVYTNLSEIINPILIEKVSTGKTPYGPSLITGSVINATTAANTNPAESWEGQLIKIANAEITVALDATNYYFTASDDGGTTSFRIGDNVIYHLTGITLSVGDKITITGVCDYEDGAYRINPRSNSDIVSAVGTVSSTKYTVNNVAITNIPFSTSLATFKANITAIAGATGFDVFDDAAGTTPATVLDDTKFVVVTAADGITKKSYTITRNAVLTGKDFTAFSITTLSLHTGVIADPNINVEIGFSDLKNDLVPVFTPSEGATVKIGSTVQQSGVTHADFSATGSLVYKVTAENGETKDWTITVTNAATPLNGNDILTYSIAGINATVNPTLHTINITVPYSSNLTDLVATYTLSEKATAKIGAAVQESGITHNDFTTGLSTYTITAEDGTPQDWTVSVTKAPASNDATLSDIKFNTTSVSGFAQSIIKYYVTLPTGTTDIPIVTATKSNQYATITSITPATSITGDITTRTATILVTAENGDTKTYTIIFRVDNVVKELFFSEYIEGSSNNKAIEIYNPTGAPVDLSAYTIKQSNNGSGFGNLASGPSTTCALQLSGTLAAGDVYIIYNAIASTAISSVGDLISPSYPAAGANITSFNGNDALALYKGTTLIDVFGIEITTAASFDIAGTIGASVDHTIIRKPTVYMGNTNWATSSGTTPDNSEWIVYDKDVFSYLGTHNMYPVEPTLIVSKTTLPDFGNIVSGTIGSNEASFTVKGTHLTGNIVITAPTGFEISTASGAGFTSSSPITLTQTGGNLNETTIYVKFHPTAIQTYTGNITIESDDVTSKMTVVNGTGILTDNVAPSFITDYPSVNNIGPFKADVHVKLDEMGLVYYLVLAKDATAPTNTEVKSSGKLLTNVEDIALVYDVTITGLTDNTAYDIYFVAEDKQATPNLSATVKKQITTAVVPVYTISQIQTPTNPLVSGDSPYANEYVTTSGIVTAISSVGGVQAGFYMQNGSGAWNGIYVYTSTPVSLLDNITVTALVKEFYMLTELEPVNNVVNITGSAASLPEPVEVTTLAANDEMYESVLVKVNNATCAAGGSSGSYSVNDDSGVLKVYKGLFADLALVATNKYRITGILYDYYAISTSTHTYELLPRSLGDIFNITTGVNDNQNLNLKVFPNPFSNEIRFEGVENVKRVIITSVTGQVVKNEVVGQVNTISTSELPQGMYIVTFMNDKGEKMNLKMFKQ